MKKYLVIITLLIATYSKSQNLLAIPDTLSGTSFNLSLLDTSKVFYPGFTTQTFGVNAAYLGPTLFLNKGDSVAMHVSNELMDTTTIHWHGLHVSAMNDGGPHIVIPPGTVWEPSFKVRDHAAMYWYHPHLHMMTNLHATLGAAGLIIVRDSAEAALNLPRTYGVDDIPLVIQSKCFDANKQIVVGNASDSVVLVNGTLHAYYNLPAQVVRLRVLNASSERVYNLGFQGNIQFAQIGSDGGLLNAPVSLTRLRLAPGERAELLVDLSALQGQTIQLMSFASEFPSAIYGALQPGMGAGQTIPGYTGNVLNGANFQIMSFVIGPPSSNPVTAIPSALVTNVVWSTATVNANRTLTFSPVTMGPTAIQGPFLINGSSFDMNTVNYNIPLDNIEIWTLTNQSPIAHPFHIHDVQFYITDINGAVPPANMAGRKDVVLVPAGQSVKFITKFETFCDSMATYMYHCHMLPHEDDGMMGQFTVQCPSSIGVENLMSSNNLAVFPNPANDFVTVKVSSGIPEYKISIVDIKGTVVFEKEIETSFEQLRIDLSNVTAGVYSIQILSKSGREVRKLNVIK